MKTSREVYMRVRWDARLAAEEFTVGYEERRAASGMRETPLTEFVPDGDVPWHRVWYFKRNGQLVWDRKTRLDLIFHSGPKDKTDVPQQRAAPTKATKPLQSTPAWRFDTDSQAWKHADGLQQPPSALYKLRVVTYNVLQDTHDPQRLHTKARIPALIASLKASGADIIGLQEITRTFMDAFVADPWVKKTFWMTEGPPATTLGTGCGQVLLSRWPIAAAHRHDFSPQKRLIIAQINAPGLKIAAAVVHLTSNRAESARNTRAGQLRTTLEHLQSFSDAPFKLLMGDFNAEDDELSPAHSLGYVDGWRAAMGDTPGATFDPGKNALAAHFSLQSHPRRFDRILVDAPAGRTQVTNARLLGQDPIKDAPEPLFVSDHYGLSCEIRLREPIQGLDSAPTVQSAASIIPPEDTWGPIQAIRTRHDKSFERWMPHINLLYGFIPQEHHAAALPVLRDVLQRTQPFDVILGKPQVFKHGASATVWLAPKTEPPGQLRALQQALQTAFPQCKGQNAHGSDGFTPHLTIAQFSDLQQARDKARAWGQSWHPARFTVHHLQLLARQDKTPFQVTHSLPLGPRPGLEASLSAARPSQAETDRRRKAMEALQRASVAVTGAPSMRAMGSQALGAALPGADIDVVCLGPAHLSAEAFFKALPEALSATGSLSGPTHYLRDALSPTLKATVEGVEMDIQYAALPQEISLDEIDALAADDLPLFDMGSRLALVGLFEAELIEQKVRAALSWEDFQTALRAIKYWASQRRIDANAFGYLGGISWAILMAVSALQSAERQNRPGPEGLLLDFFDHWAHHDWQQPIGLSPQASEHQPSGRRDRMMILTSTEPLTNTARAITRDTRRVINGELQRAWSLLQKTSDWTALFDPQGILEGYPHTLELKPPPGSDDPYGWLKRQGLTTLLHLEDAHDVPLRPVPPRGEAVLVIGCAADIS